MTPAAALWAVGLLALSAAAFSIMDDQEALLAVELAESDYADMCAESANASWGWLLDPTYNHLKLKLQADEDLAQARRSNADSLREFSDPASLEDAGLRERVELASTPGAAALLLPEYRKVIKFAAHSQNITQTQTVPCYQTPGTADSRCSLDWTESQMILTDSHDPYQAHHVWIQWHKVFAGQSEEFRYLHDLLLKSAIRNGAANVSQYWQLLTDSTETEINATWLWEQYVQEMYVDLKIFVLSRLRYQYGQDMVGDDDLLPVHLLGSFIGDDWLHIADLVTPPFQEAYKNLTSALKKKGWGGQHLYEVAAGVGSKMGLPSLKKSLFWENAHFNGSCPAMIVSWCSKNYVSVQTCKGVGLHTYLDAHRVMMHALLHQLSIHNGRYILRQLNRHSALLEALMGVGELIAMSQQQLVRLGLLTEGNTKTDAQLRLLVALRTLPRLAHALAADNWRSEGINATWNDFSATIKGVRPPRDLDETWEFVQDNTIALNQPYLGTFAGIILQFQLFEKLTQDNMNDSVIQNPVDTIKKDGTLRKLMVAGLSGPWLEVVNKVLGINVLDPGPMLRYFAPIKNILLTGLPPETPQVTHFVRLPLPPDVAKEAPPVVATEAPPDTPTEASRSQEMGATRKPHDAITNSSPLPVPPDSELKKESNDNSQIILIGSLSLIGIGLAAGVFLVSRHLYRKKKQRERRNRRPT